MVLRVKVIETVGGRNMEERVNRYVDKHRKGIKSLHFPSDCVFVVVFDIPEEEMHGRDLSE